MSAGNQALISPMLTAAGMATDSCVCSHTVDNIDPALP